MVKVPNRTYKHWLRLALNLSEADSRAELKKDLYRVWQHNQTVKRPYNLRDLQIVADEKGDLTFD